MTLATLKLYSQSFLQTYFHQDFLPPTIELTNHRLSEPINYQNKQIFVNYLYNETAPPLQTLRELRHALLHYVRDVESKITTHDKRFKLLANAHNVIIPKKLGLGAILAIIFSLTLILLTLTQ